ncbi:MAG: ATP-dependent Clp protease proteolytic subunit [Chloroflexi bacterium]|nr:ATP-dependent Clp protease proteolytic subunit [Chloroflexota bacterium]
MDFLNLLWLFFILSALVPAIQRWILVTKRQMAIHALERKRKSRVITMIHRQETMSILGIPISRYIDIEDSEQVLRAIRLTDENVPIDLVLHTPGGLVLAAEQIACALNRHKAKVTVFVPHYAMSGGTLVALAADEIVMDPNAVLGPVDPQLGTPGGAYYPAASVLAALKQENPNRDDQTLILGDVAKKAIQQVYNTVFNLLRDNLPEETAKKIAGLLSDGTWTHDYPISVEEARGMGLPVTEDMPREIYELMDLYPQAGPRRPSVEFIPQPYRPVPPARRNGESV